MSTLPWIITSGFAMSVLALVGSVTLLLRPETLRRILLPLVAFAAGTLLGGALLHMLPGAVEISGPRLSIFVWVLVGFAAFFALEQFLYWRHSHREVPTQQGPFTYLILIGDGLHNFLGGLAVGGAFIADIGLGISAWVAAAAHEVPQELGDFGVLIHGGWGKARALLFNFLSGLTFLFGGIVSYVASFAMDVTFLLPLAAGNFLYIAASDLIPEVKTDHGTRDNLIHFAAFTSGIALLYLLRFVLQP
jgi:zinc and cadmium transporter